MVVAPAGAVTAPLVHVVEATGPTTFIPGGSVSTNDQPNFDANSLVLVIVNVNCAVCPATCVAVLNAWSSCGVASITWRLSTAASLPSPPPSLLIICAPSVAPVNATDPD